MSDAVIEALVEEVVALRRRVEALETHDRPRGLARIATVTLAANQPTVDFQNIPQTYAALMLVFYGRTDQASVFSTLALRCNNDAGANYDYSDISHSGTSFVAAVAVNQSSAVIAQLPGAQATASYVSSGTLWLPAYASTAFQKSWQATSNFPNTIDGRVTVFQGIWHSTAAITRITLLPGGTNFVAGSMFALYGVT